MIAHHRQIGRQVVELLGVGVVVLAGVQRHVHAGQSTQVPRPQASGVGHELCPDVAVIGGNAAHAPVAAVDVEHLDTFETGGAVLARTLDERRDHVDRARVAVLGDPAAAEKPPRLEQRVERAHLLRADDVDAGDAEGVVHRRDALELLEARLAVGDAEAAHLAKARGLPGLLLELVDEAHGVLAQPGVALVGAHGADQPGRVPAGAAGKLPALEQHHVAPAELGQVIGDARADDAAADDDRAGALR